MRNPLVAKSAGGETFDSDSESDLDTEDETERQDRREVKKAEEADWTLTTKEKFVQELFKPFNGSGKKELEIKHREKERKERRKLAKDVVKVMRRYERRQNRKATGQSSALEKA